MICSAACTLVFDVAASSQQAIHWANWFVTRSLLELNCQWAVHVAHFGARFDCRQTSDCIFHSIYNICLDFFAWKLFAYLLIYFCYFLLCCFINWAVFINSRCSGRDETSGVQRSSSMDTGGHTTFEREMDVPGMLLQRGLFRNSYILCGLIDFHLAGVKWEECFFWFLYNRKCQ